MTTDTMIALAAVFLGAFGLGFSLGDWCGRLTERLKREGNGE